MTLKEFLEKYVSKTENISVFLVSDDGSFLDTLIYRARVKDVFEVDAWLRILDWELNSVSGIGHEGLVIDVRAEGE